MLKNLPPQAPEEKRRLRRRTHKNSKDGCPNCRANRIKCSEDLPICLYCRKKNFRCGYLDFPPEKLDHIRRKNLLLRSLAEQIDVSPSLLPHPHYAQHYGYPLGPPSLQTPQNQSVQTHGLSNQHLHSLPNNIHSQGLPNSQNQALQHPQHQNLHLHPNNIQSLPLHPLAHPAHSIAPPLPPAPQNLQRNPHQVPHYNEPSDGHHNILDVKLPPQVGASPASSHGHTLHTPENFGYNLSPQSVPQPILQIPYEDFRPRSPTNDRVPHARKRIRIRDGPDALSRKGLVTLLSTNVRTTVYANVMSDITPAGGQWAKEAPLNMKRWVDGQPFNLEAFEVLPASFDERPMSFDFARNASENSDRLMPSTTTAPSATSTFSPRPAKRGLPNCRTSVCKFRVQTVPKHLQSERLDHAVKNVKDGRHVEFLEVSGSNEIRPVWTENDSTLFWLDIFQRATVFELFFNYFVDKSLNILMRASEAVVTGDIVYSPLELSSASPVSSVPNSFLFFYNNRDLEILTGKSLVTYGRVISELRASISLYDAEYPARMSLFSAWACYMNPTSDLNTFSLMLCGTLILLKNLLAQLLDQKDRTFRMRRELMILNSFTNQSRYPDYTFQAVRELNQMFASFKGFVDGLIFTFEDGGAVSEETLAVLSDPLFRHNYHELGKFFKRLLEYYYPQIQECNRYYKTKSQYPDDNNIHFVSPALIFELTYEWFRVYPGDKMLMGTKISPIKKVLYVFYHALAKCLAHVITPIKLVLFADACNVIFTKVGMQFLVPQDLYKPEYQVLMPLLKGLYKVIRFFENRLRLFGYYLSCTSVLDEEYMRRPEDEAPTDWQYRDVIHVCPLKIEVRENQLEHISQSNVGVHNFAIFEELRADPVSAGMIEAECERQKRAMQHEPCIFDFNRGMTNHDFDPEEVINYLANKRRTEAPGLRPTAERTCCRIDMLLSGRNEATNAYKAAFPGA